MVLPAPLADALPVEPHWFDKIVVAIELSAHGVLTLVDHAAPSRLREAYLRLRARDSATDLVVDVRRLADLAPGTTVILALTPSITPDALDWLNLNRPLVADRRLNVVLWCEDDAAAILARGAPDFFDWISARVDCPPAPAAFAVADVKAAIRAHAPGIAWIGPGLEETLAAVRPGRRIRRVRVASYQSMIDALTGREPGWLFLDGIETDFHLRRLRWAMAESGRRVIMFRKALEDSLPGWWTVHALHVPIADAVQELVAATGSGRLAALTDLDATAITAAMFLRRQGIEAAHLEALFLATAHPRALLQDLTPPSKWPRYDTWFRETFDAARLQVTQEALRHARDEDPVVARLRERPSDGETWTSLGGLALEAGDFEVASRWLSMAPQLFPENTNPAHLAIVLTQRGRAHHGERDLAAARADLEQAHAHAKQSGEASLIALSATALASVLTDAGESRLARACIESVLNTSSELSSEVQAMLEDGLAVSLLAERHVSTALKHLLRSLSIRRRALGTDDHPSISTSLRTLGRALLAQEELVAARSHLERSLTIDERLWGTDHLALAPTLRDIAHVQWRTGDLNGARESLGRALAILRRVLRRDHPDIALTLSMLGRVLADAGDPIGATRALNEALAIQHQVNEGLSVSSAMVRRDLASVLVAQGNLVGAIEHLQQVLATLQQRFERDDHPDIVATRQQLERLQALQRDVQRPD
jgi:tetratricopeptide (TPR) repeat protein